MSAHDSNLGLPRSGSPLMIEVTRGKIVESIHRGRAIICNAYGQILDSWGDYEAPVYPRSSIKAIQALPLVESGAADAFNVSSNELALACGSHRGEAIQLDAIKGWMTRMDLDEDAMVLGAPEPGKSKYCHCCSGEHAGLLATAKHIGAPLKGYGHITHPVQQRILGILEQMSCQDLRTAPISPDGCAIPTIAMPLGGLALAMANLANPDNLPPHRQKAISRILDAWRAHPESIDGPGRLDTEIIQATGGKALVKSGAEGTFTAVLPKQGLGIALKIDDGRGRAAVAAMTALLRLTGELDDAMAEGFYELSDLPITNSAGEQTGSIKAASSFPENPNSTSDHAHIHDQDQDHAQECSCGEGCSCHS